MTSNMLACEIGRLLATCIVGSCTVRRRGTIAQVENSDFVDDRAASPLWTRKPMLIGAGGVVATVVVAVIVGFAVGSSGPPIYSGLGYDVSYPQCPLFESGASLNLSSHPPEFLVIGLGAGRPFTTSRCLASEWHWATTRYTSATHSIYFNTGYDQNYLRYLRPNCTHILDTGLDYSPHGASTTMTEDEQAWRLGCSEADYAISVAASFHVKPSFLWADVEVENSWSLNSLVNRYVVDGLSWRMHHGSGGIGGGFYAPSNSWETIVGYGIGPSPAAPRWASGARPLGGLPTKCGTTTASGFSAMSINQGATWHGIDTNFGCG